MFKRLGPNPSYAEYRDILIETFMQFPNSFEADSDIYDRGQQFKRFIREHLKHNPLPEGEKIGVVSHSMFMMACTASGLKVDAEGEKRMTDVVKPMNCQCLPWTSY